MQGSGGLLWACVRGQGRCRPLEVLTAQVRGVRAPVRRRAVWLSGSLGVLVTDLQRNRTDRVCVCVCTKRVILRN